MTEQQRIRELELENEELRRQLDGGHKTSGDRSRYYTIFENSLLGNKIISPDLKILQVNEALVRLLGFRTKEELIGREILEFVHPDFIADWKRLQDRLWKKNVPSFDLETCLVRQDGSTVWVHVTSILFRDGADTLGYTVIEDIADRRLNLDELRISEKHFRTITDIMPQQVWTANAQGSISYVNRQVRKYFGMDDTLTDEDWRSVVHPDDLAQAGDAWQRAVSDREPYQVEYRLRSSTGEYRWFLSRAVPVFDDDHIVLWLGTSTDIDEQKAKETQKDEFLSIASHELKTPLTSIKLFNQLAQTVTDPDKKQDLLQRSSAHVNRLERLISDLLDVTKINAGKVNYEIARFNYHETLEAAVAAVQVSTTTQIKVHLEGAPTVLGDRHRLEQVINNLLLNAVKYSPGADRIEVSTQLVNDSVITAIRDFGIGIAPQDISKLFDRYYRVDNTANRFDGLGLGLYISAEILKRHNGSLWLESEPGQGSTFYFILPLNGQSLLTDIETDGKTFYSGNFIRIRYNPAHRWLEADWLGYQNLESVKKGCMIMLDLLKKTGSTQVLNDNTYVQGNWSEASDWGADFWFPAMAEAGLKQFAWIYSPSMFSRLAAEKSIENQAGAFSFRFFDSRDAAADWLTARQSR